MAKRFIKTIIISLIVNIFLLVPTFGENLIYENKSSEIVSQGVIHETIKRLTDSGWLNINVLRVDLTNKYINLDTIFSKNGISNRTDVLQMAKDNGAIAAINADFFSSKPGTNLAHSVGPVVKNGKLITTPASEENSNIYGVFSLSKSNKPLFGYWTQNISVTAPNGKSLPIYDVNKFGWYTFLYMYDSNWGSKTIGKTDTFPTLTEMIVVNNKVKSFNIASDPIDMPKNGYVICGDYDAGKFLQDNFKIGDTVKVNTVISPNLNLIKTAVGGGAILVQNGIIPTFSHNIAGNNPRTSLGISKDGKQAILVTVDGRQLSSRGFNQTEMANLMIELGAYNAINFDGGGSTTMVTRNIYNSQLEVVNSLSEPSERAVIDGIGVFSSAPASNLSQIKVTSSSQNVFNNSSIQLWVSGFDTYNNPKEVILNDVQWSVKGVTGKFVGNTFYPSSSGKATITATINNISSSLTLNVLEYPYELQLSNNSFTTSQSTISFTITGKDKNGYSAPINLKDVTITPKTAATLDGNNLKISKGFSGLIKISFKSVYAYIGISSDKNTVLESFEIPRHSFWGYPDTVKGNFSISSDVSKDGKSSGKLEFDFSQTNGTKGAYIKFNGDGFIINSNPKNVSIWAYADKVYSHSIKAEFADANNNIFRTTLSPSINWSGWKNLTSTLPTNITYPVSLKKIYIVESDTQIKDNGVIYFDLLELNYGNNSSIKIPASKKLPDIDLNYNPSAKDSYSIAVFGNTDNLTQILQDSLIKSINVNSNYAAIINTSRPDINVPNIINNNKFNKSEYCNTLFISLTAKGTSNSIRLKDSSQWNSLFNLLKNNTKQNIIILLDTPISGNNGFSDYLEANLLKQTLSDYVKDSNKNIWVIYNSSIQTIDNENGVKYICVSDKSTNYLKITTSQSGMTYQFCKIN